ncbi:hypothetical protein M0R45_000974 [Rubus argutus]|uniref:Uncharacterized protein n=1 Tax=Rubus argutus TaxID=59490 RepID=A0AAW1VTR2_RUBAR
MAEERKLRIHGDRSVKRSAEAQKPGLDSIEELGELACAGGFVVDYCLGILEHLDMVAKDDGGSNDFL